jgi:hypothetical protein
MTLQPAICDDPKLRLAPFTTPAARPIGSAMKLRLGLDLRLTRPWA